MVRVLLEYGCGNCGAELEDREGGWFRRHVPRRGKKLPVCPPCASLIDRQGELGLDEQVGRG